MDVICGTWWILVMSCHPVLSAMVHRQIGSGFLLPGCVNCHTVLSSPTVKWINSFPVGIAKVSLHSVSCAKGQPFPSSCWPRVHCGLRSSSNSVAQHRGINKRTKSVGQRVSCVWGGRETTVVPLLYHQMAVVHFRAGPAPGPCSIVQTEWWIILLTQTAI